jgi:hypothetical protein
MSRELLKKPAPVVQREPEKPKSQAAIKTKTRVFAQSPKQMQRATAKLEQNRSALQLQTERAVVQREAREQLAEESRVQRGAAQAVEAANQAQIQRAQEVRARQQAFFSGFNKPPTQRKSLENVKTSGMTASKTRDQYQAAIQPEIVQRLVNDQMTATIQAARATQQQNALTTRADWFNTELPVLRAQHNHPDTPFSDTASVFKPTDQQAFGLGNTYKLQRLSSGLTPQHAASAILNIQRKADRDIALQGLLTGVNPRQSDYSSIQRLVAAGEHDLEVQRQVLLEGDEIQRQAFQLAKEEAHPTTPNSGISERIKAKLGGGSPLPENVRSQLETGLNVSLERVRVHTDGEADKLAKSVNAIAFTTGKDIFFSSGSYNPNTKSGYELIAHEVTHTVQQASGQVSPGIDTSSSLETEAQNKGSELARTFDPNAKPKPKAKPSFQNVQNIAQPNSPLLSSQPVAQRLKLEALQRSSITNQTSTTPNSSPKIGNLEGLQRSAPMFGASTLQRSSDGTTIQRSWWNPFDWAKDAASWLGDKFMQGLEWMGEKAAKAFMEVFAVAAKPFGETGKQVLNAIKSIGSSLLNVITNPGQFARNLIEGIKLGFTNFITNAPKHLTSVLGSFLGGKGLNLTFPTKLEPLPILMAFISSLNLGWDRIKLKIAAQLGPKGGQALAAAEKAPGIVQTISKGLHNSDEFTKEVLPTLKTEAVDGIKSAAQEGLIRAGIGVLLKLIPGAGTVLAIFDTVRVLIDRGRDIVSLASNVMGAFSAIASGNLATAAIAVENSLVSGIKVALDFIAKLAKIDTFISRVRDIIGRVTKKISSVVDPIIKKAANFVKPYLDKLTNGAGAVKDKVVGVAEKGVAKGKEVATNTASTAKKLITGVFGKASFNAGKEQHSVWVKMTNNQPELWIASTPREATAQINALEAEAKTKNILPLVAASIKMARDKVNSAKVTLKKKVAAGVVDDIAMNRHATEVVNGVEHSIQDVFDQLEKGTSEANLKLNLNFNQLKHEFWSGGRPAFSSATKAALGTLSASEDRRHIQAFDDIFKNAVAAISGKTFKDAGAWLESKGFKPTKLELQELKNKLKAHLNKEFSRLENLWVGEKKENQQKGSNFGAAEKELKGLKEGTPEYKAALAKRSAAVVDPAKGSANGEKIGATEQVWISIITNSSRSLQRYQRLHKNGLLKPNTNDYQDARNLRTDIETAQKGLGDFSKKMNQSEFLTINSMLTSAAKVMYELNKILV